ncbi:4-(cytidine 5'-diphospho)-2-C-methyl-D-erythritol kinase [Dellaglioa algida]|uniref:4-diphosphocytidyl-2-C-methyl-D-erythritol kinase n=2 Tax=Dellaglioa algida TaxID=105612 RepID=A0A0R1HFM2_9LACO|nr:4-(cytidine 5'-diphospho)-2-C-methyl-D-erythritol kinase [Dellaglioa algida]KRK45205.1 4-diphosphocytidyl-2-C-methyl-D-erythritol kinase [Dellaglioa algida DSM 15638]MDK1717540.1 4-(cytidine 5'-diphospho)-2-C-methyl-D-erythritol kinase [Dellaglioa algida]MDK1718913.1 4-(cytidine 5'-diphospho)-2-C-methyl-D-erythritol kinase [Dellaglioa algida]MDK1720820.1 4-(cytidine 5'-diphospho)-2-C-methyl-D-erythritol kinase [Dellaglioa algida]MDK1722489.1 4-(cytidine 5'-diphospho)-2-C-methyl-D-erythritol
MEIREKAPAKINLSLDTPFHHQDGEQEWRMVMTSVDLADYLHIKSLEDRTDITVETDSGFLPCDHRNLAYQAAKILQDKFHINKGAQIHIKKQIPVAAGLGGGSSDAAAVLRALNKLWELKLSLAELAKIGLKIDSDVPYCVYSRTAHVTGRGEKIAILKELPPVWLVVAKPKISVSTPTIIRQIDYTHLVHPNVNAIVNAIEDDDVDALIDNLGNALEPITAERYPEITRLKKKMIKFGADAAEMSGSGPTVFAICRKKSRAQHVYNSLKGFCEEVYLVRPLS